MFKKLRSNRDPEFTLFSEIRKEFGNYFDKMECSIDSFCKKYPIQIFQAMVLLMIISFTLSFTVFRSPGTKSGKPQSIKPTTVSGPKDQAINIASGGFDKILSTGSAIKETIALKQEIESILAKKELSAEDKEKLMRALNRLEQLNKSLK